MNTSFRDRNTWLVVVFVGFLINIFIFASIHYALYRRRRNYYSFNSDIQSTQSRRLEELQTEKLANLHGVVGILEEIEANMGSFSAADFNIHYRLPSGSGAKIFVVGAPGPQGQPETDTFVSFYAPDGRTLLTSGPFGDRQPGDVFVRVLDEKTDIQDQISRIATNLLRLKDNPNLAEIWGFWDFVYFSTITQTTVGYGDILPNSTTVRILVILQILMGLLLTIVGVNLVFSSSR